MEKTGGSVELEVELLGCTFNEKHQFYLSASTEFPQPSSLPGEPGQFEDKRVTARVVLRTEESSKTFEPRFLDNKFVFKVPCVVSNRNEILVFKINFEVFCVEQKDRKRETRLVGTGTCCSNEEISKKLLTQNSISHIVYIHKHNSEHLLGSVDVRFSLNVAKGNGRKVTVKKRQPELKLTNLVEELRTSTQLQLEVLSEANKFTNENFAKYLRQINEEMESKKHLVERLLVELDDKSEVIDTYKYQLKNERNNVKNLEKEILMKDEIVNELKQRENLLSNSNESFHEIQKLQKRNLVLVKKYNEMKELERAHTQQSKILLEFQKKFRQAREYKKIAKKQEMIIRKLEKVIKTEFSRGEKKKSGKGSGKKHPEQIIHELHNRTESLEDELRVKNDRVQTLEELFEVKDNRLRALEQELDLVTRKSAKEISMLRIKLAENGIDYSEIVVETARDGNFSPQVTFNQLEPMETNFLGNEFIYPNNPISFQNTGKSTQEGINQFPRNVVSKKETIPSRTTFGIQEDVGEVSSFLDMSIPRPSSNVSRVSTLLGYDDVSLPPI